MHQNSWRPHWRSLQRSPRLPSWRERGLPPPPQELHPRLSPSGFELRPFGPRLAPAMLISFRRHCTLVPVFDNIRRRTAREIASSTSEQNAPAGVAGVLVKCCRLCYVCDFHGAVPPLHVTSAPAVSSGRGSP